MWNWNACHCLYYPCLAYSYVFLSLKYLNFRICRAHEAENQSQSGCIWWHFNTKMWWFDIISHANSVEIDEMNFNDKKGNCKKMRLALNGFTFYYISSRTKINCKCQIHCSLLIIAKKKYADWVFLRINWYKNVKLYWYVCIMWRVFKSKCVSKKFVWVIQLKFKAIEFGFFAICRFQFDETNAIKS